MILTLPYELLGSGVFVKIEPPYLATAPQNSLQLPRIHRREKHNPTKTTKENGIIRVLHQQTQQEWGSIPKGPHHPYTHGFSLIMFS